MNAALQLGLMLNPDALFAGTSLPRSDAALCDYCEAMDRIIVAFEPDAEYMSTLDAVAAILVPGLRDDVLAYYDDEGPRLDELGSADQLEALDDWLATAIDICIDIAEANIGENAGTLRDCVRRFVHLG